MKFNNEHNKCHEVIESGEKRIIWESRSVAVNLVLIIWKKNDDGPYILVSKRGKSAADNIGKMNLVAGYLDYNETGKEAIFRETWEECGLNLPELIKNSTVISNNLDNPWSVNTDPSENRQNVSLRYGLALRLHSNHLPILSIEFNEIKGESEDPQWILENQIEDFEWAFNHDQLIKEYIE